MIEHAPTQRSAAKRFLLLLSFVALAAALAAWAFSSYAVLGPAVILGCAFLALYFQGHPRFGTYTFTFWVFALFFAGLVYPAPFSSIGGFPLSRLIVPLIQIIMFGMGASLGADDFARALKMPRAVLVGMFLQFTVMPLTGWTIATVFRFEPEIAAGIILIGSCSGGVASNVMTYLARGNVALSVTMTACSTIMAPFITPFAMKILAGRLIEIQVFPMMMSIVNLIILPIAAGLLTNWLLRSDSLWYVWRPAAVAAGVGSLALTNAFPAAETQLVSLGAAFVLMSFLRQHWLEATLPVVSMAGICYILAIIAASTRKEILTVGVGLFGAALLHNLVGYFLGYWGARLSRIPETDCRTVAIEVGMQNGGMGTALAIDVLRSANAALAPAIFGVWMNISGSVLASWWRDRVPRDQQEPTGPGGIDLPKEQLVEG